MAAYHESDQQPELPSSSERHGTWTGLFQCRCIECDTRFESHRPDFICDRCDYLNCCGDDDREDSEDLT